MSEKKVWDCSRCTYRNNLNINKCEICLNDRPELKIKRAEIVNATAAEFWQCKTCSLLNNSEQCEVCGTTRQQSFENNYLKPNDGYNNFQSIKKGFI